MIENLRGKLIKEIAAEMSKKRQSAEKKVEENREKCLKKAGDDAEVYVQCALKSMETQDKNEQLFEHKLSHIIYQFEQCVGTMPHDRTVVTRCHTDGLKSAQKYFDEFVGSL
jgi:hypothetical protein